LLEDKLKRKLIFEVI